MSKLKIKLIAIILVVVAILGMLTGLIGYYSNWFTNWDNFNPKNWVKNDKDEQIKGSSSNSIFNVLASNGVSFVSENIDYSDYAIKGVPDNADSAHELIARISPNLFENKTINWNLRWSNSNSAWAADKDISDYLTFSKSTTQSGESVVVTCLQDFGEQIIVTASAEADSLKKVDCTVDYFKKVKDIAFKLSIDTANHYEEAQLDSDNVYRIDYISKNTRPLTIVPEIVYSDYTIDVNYTTSIVGAFTDTFCFGQDVTLTQPKFAYCIYDNKDYSTFFTSFSNPWVFCREVTFIGQGVDQSINVLGYENAEEAYNKLTTEEKNHPLVSYYREAMLQTTKELKQWKKVQDYLDKYVPNLPYSFLGVDIASYDEFFEKALLCNQENKGIVEYTITFTSDIAVYERKISLGYTSNSLKAVCDIEIDNGEIII